MIPPQELGKKAFTRAVRGYEASEVDDYVEYLIGKYTDIYKQCELYDKKLRLVAQEIARIQEREDEIRSKEDTISKTIVSTQVIHDQKIGEAQDAAEKMIRGAEAAAEKILADARERAQKALEAVAKRTEAQIESAREKSESLYLAARARCAKLLGDFKKEIGSQKERITALMDASENFSQELSEAYARQIEAIKDAAVYAPAIDLGKLTETRLFSMIMEEIKEDMEEIEAKNGGVEYEFEKELMLLRDFDFADEHIREYKSGIAEPEEDGLASEESGAEDGAVDEEGSGHAPEDGAESAGAAEGDADMKVFAGGANISEETDAADDEPIATYDSDDYQEEGYSHDSGIRAGYSGDIVYEEDSDIDKLEEENTGGLLGFFKSFGKRKKPEIAAWDDDIDEPDDIYGELEGEEDDDKVMSIFEGLDEEDEESIRK